MQKAINLIKLAFGWPLSIVAIFFIVRFLLTNSAKVNISLKDIDPTLFVLSIICFSIYFLLRSFIWKKLMEYFGYELKFSENLHAWSFSEVKRYIPGNLWSFLSRAQLFSEKKVDKRKIFKSLLFEFDLIVLGSAILSIPSAQFISSQLKIQFFFSYIIIALFFLGILLFVLNAKLKLPKINKLFPAFAPMRNLNLLGLSLLAFLFFGLGTYLSAASFFNLRNLSPLTLIAFFNFSFLIGYISFMTPMGLGVREAVIAVGLSSVLGAYNASALAIFTRIVLVFSEMTFLGTVLSFTHAEKLESFIKNHVSEILVAVGIFLFNLYFISASFLRYTNYYTGRFDLGNMAQTVWNTSHGKIFELTNPGGVSEISRLAVHADFILILLTPFYMIWSDPRVLLLIQVVILSFGAVFVFLISKEVLKNKFISAVLALSYLVYPAIQYVSLYDFHGVALSTTFLLGAFYSMIRKRYLIFLLFLVLSGLTKEDIWVIVGLFGLFVAVWHRKYVFGASIFAVSVFIFYFLVWHAIPKALGGEHFALAYYSDFGSSPGAVVKNVILSPLKTIPMLFGREQLDYVRQLFLPLGYFSIFAPIFLVFTGPDLLIGLLSNNSQLHQIYYQYSSSITPFIFISAIFGIKFLSSKIKEIPLRGWGFMVIIFSVLNAYVIGPLPFERYPSIQMFVKPLPNREVVDSYLNSIPDNASIASTNNLGSHLSERQEIFTVPMGINKAKYVIFLLNDKDESQYNGEKNIASAMRSNKNYFLAFEQGNFLVFKKFQSSSP